jgi:hypothetical protein
MSFDAHTLTGSPITIGAGGSRVRGVTKSGGTPPLSNTNQLLNQGW